MNPKLELHSLSSNYPPTSYCRPSGDSPPLITANADPHEFSHVGGHATRHLPVVQVAESPAQGCSQSAVPVPCSMVKDKDSQMIQTTENLQPGIQVAIIARPLCTV